MKLTIDNHDGKGAVDYSACVVAGHPCRIVRRLNEPVTFAVTLLPAQGLVVPARNGRVTVADDAGHLLFTGYICTEPALALAGQATTGAVYVAVAAAISDDILLSRQPLPQAGAVYGATAGQGLTSLFDRVQIAGITLNVSEATHIISEFEMESGHTWAENAGALANATRNTWRLMNGTLTLAPVGSVTHTLDETQGTLSVGDLQLSMVKALANDVTVCGEIEPCAYVTEFFEGDGTTVLFNLTEEPWMPATTRRKPLVDLFQGPSINTQLWYVGDPGAYLSLTGNGLTCSGGSGSDGCVTLSTISNLELGGGLLIEVAGVQFGTTTVGTLNGLYNSDEVALADCIAGFQLTQPNGTVTIGPLINGNPSGSLFTPTAGHTYTLRLRIYASEAQRLLQSYYAPGDPSGFLTFGGTFVNASASVVLEVQDTTNGVAGVPTALYSGTIAAPPPYCLFAPLNAANLDCSMGSVTVETMGGTLPGTARWMGTVTSPAPRSSADCENAANAVLSVATSRVAAWSGRYTGWNLDQQGDVWPGDVLAVSAASAGLTANLVVRAVEIDLAASSPELVKYVIGFANDWADELAVKSTSSVPADAWLPPQPDTATPLANLNALAVTSINGSQIQIAAGVTPPASGGFEVRRRDWSFTPGPGPDLVLRTSVPNFTIPRQAAIERYYIRMYDGSTPPNYSRFSAAVFVNLPL